MVKRTLLLAVLPAVMLGGCSGTKNRGLESVHQPVVSRTDFSFDVGTGPNGLAPGEEQRLAGWMNTLRLGYGDSVAIDDPAGLTPAARDAVTRSAARFGLLVGESAAVTGAPVAPGTLRVVVSRARASVPNCPDFSRVRQPEFESNTSSNQGCAINSNLAAMVANPLDLVRGEPGTQVYDAATGTRAITEYRKATPTGAGGTTLKIEKAGSK